MPVHRVRAEHQRRPRSGGRRAHGRRRRRRARRAAARRPLGRHASPLGADPDRGAPRRCTPPCWRSSPPPSPISTCAAHRGAHPRIGAVDVVPFVPLTGATMDDCDRSWRTRPARRSPTRFAVPVFLYERAATRPERARPRGRPPRPVRGTGREAGAPGLARPTTAPPRRIRAGGASVIGARGRSFAYNINLATNRLDVATKVAGAVREQSAACPR